jgi:hypothetical protein
MSCEKQNIQVAVEAEREKKKNNERMKESEE